MPSATSRALSKTLAVLVIVIVAVAAAAALLIGGRGGGMGATYPTSPTTTTVQATLPPTGTANQTKARVLVLFDVGGKGDLSFNDMAVLGAERARRELGVEVYYQTPSSIAAMESLLRSESKSGRYDLIIGVGFLWLDPIVKVAPEFPQQKYAIIDAAPAQPISNVAGYVFREQEVAALVGILAADMARNLGCKNVGAVVGMDIPPLWRFHIGYLYGVQFYNNQTGSNVGLMWAVTGTFNDPQKGKQTAEMLIAQGACVLYGLAGLTHVGMFDAVIDANSRGVKALAIGQDASQEWYAPQYIIVSGLKRVDVAVYDAIKSVVDGNFTGGTHSLGLKEGALGISDGEIVRYFAQIAYEQGKLPKGLTPDDVVRIVMEERKKFISDRAWSLVNQLEQAIVSGQVSFKNPADQKEYEDIIKQLESGNLDAALVKG